MFFWNLLVMFVVSILPLAIYAMRANRKAFEWKILFSDNVVRFVAAGIIIIVLSFIITFVPDLQGLNELLTASGFVIGSATAGGFGFAIGLFLVTVLPSDTGIKELKNS